MTIALARITKITASNVSGVFTEMRYMKTTALIARLIKQRTFVC